MAHLSQVGRAGTGRGIMSDTETPIGTDLEQAAHILSRGGIVAIPTETVYGLAADAFQPEAVARIFAAKQRPAFDPLIVHIGSIDWLPRVACRVPALAQQMLEHFWPGPLTLILDKQPAVADLVTSGLPTVAVRQPAHPLASQLLSQLQRPLAAPSANLFGRTSPTTAEHVAEQLSGRIDYILDGGPCAVGLESTIVRVVGNSWRILRPGGVTREELLEFSPQEETETSTDADSDETAHLAPQAPGQLLEHYAPQTRLRIVSDLTTRVPQPGTGALLLTRTDWSGCDLSAFAVVQELSPAGDLVSAAARFFAALHELDQQGLQEIWALPFPQHGLGLALNDRLRRAATYE